MTFEQHCDESIALFGEPYEQVHLWLDEFAGKPGIGFRHRKFRHHLQGIEEAGKLFGDAAALAARAHVVSDLKMEGWTEADGIPADMEGYMKMGLY